MGEMGETERKLLQLQQACEQMGELLRKNIAPIVRQYYAALTADDAMPEEAAAMLSADVQAEMLALILHGNKAD